MDWNKYLRTRCGALTLLLLSTLIPLSKSDSSVHLIVSSYRAPVTSSTLKWLPIKDYDPSKASSLVIGGYQSSKSTEDGYNEGPSEQREMYICRAQPSGVWVAGGQLKGEKECTVTTLGSVQTTRTYELLENVDNAARLNWTMWDKFQTIPPGAVLTESMFVARHELSEAEKDASTPAYSHYIGTLNHDDNLGTIAYVMSDGEQGSTNSGELLVETEPIHYELTSVKMNHWRSRTIKSESRIIGQATINNSRSEGAKLAEAFGYKYNYSSYWGQGHAMIKALNTSIALVNKTKLPTIKWGIEERSERVDSFSVEIYLEPGTGVNVTVRGNYTDYEVPYTGQLVSHYKDGVSMSREINGVRREETMRDLRAEFGPIYFLSNMSIVPTTMPSTTTRGTTGTSSSSSTSGSTQASSSTTNGNSVINNIVANDDDDNSIIPPKSDSTVQIDDGGPQSLKNKDAQGSAASLLPCLYISTVSLVTLYRIT